LEIYREIPLQYSYFNGGATIWNEYIQRLAVEGAPNILLNTVQLLDLSAPYLQELLNDGSKINVIDIGPGNCYPVHKLLEQLIENGRLNRYICLDISPSMLDIAEEHVKGWFGDRINFEGYTRDITYERFDDLLALDSFDKDDSVKNIVLFLGSTISNFRDPNEPLHTIHSSMGKNDLLIYSKQLDSPRARRYFDFYTDPDDATIQQLPPKSRFTIGLLNIDRSMYDIESFFDETDMTRLIQVRFNVALSIKFQLEGRTKFIEFKKGDALLLYRHRHQDTFQTAHQLDSNNFELLQLVTSKDKECVLSISKVKLAAN